MTAHNSTYSGPRLDMHTHIMRSTSLIPPDEEVDTLVRLARHYDIQKAVHLGNFNLSWPSFDRPSPESIQAINSHNLQVVAQYPDFFIGFCYLNPANPISSILEEMDRCVVQGGMRGIKFETSVKATDARYDPIMARVEELGVPILHHAWYQMGNPSPNESSPAEIADLARRFPRVTIVMAHLGGARERGILDVAELTNVLIDTSGSWPESALVEYAVRRLGANRVVYGSDYPIRDFGAQTGRILGADLKQEEHGLILWGNAARVLHLEKDVA